MKKIKDWLLGSSPINNLAIFMIVLNSVGFGMTTMLLITLLGNK